MNCFFLYDIKTGEICETPYLGFAEKWTNIPYGCDVIGPINYHDTAATEALNHPNYYKVLNNKLISASNIDELRAADQAPKPIPVSELDEVKQQIADINLVLADMMGA